MNNVIFTMIVHEQKYSKYVTVCEFIDLCVEHKTDPQTLISNNFIHYDNYGVRLTGKAKGVI